MIPHPFPLVSTISDNSTFACSIPYCSHLKGLPHQGDSYPRLNVQFTSHLYQ